MTTYGYIKNTSLFHMHTMGIHNLEYMEYWKKDGSELLKNNIKINHISQND